MSREKQFCRNCGKRDHAFSQENTVRFWEPGLCSECHRLPVIGTHYDVFTGERIEPTLRHDGKLDNVGTLAVKFEQLSTMGQVVEISESPKSWLWFTPKQALSLLAWLTQEHEKLEALAKEQVERDETNIDFAEHLPPAVWKSSLPRTCSLTAACLSCHAEMHGEWEGESPYTLVCPSCGQSYTVEERIS